MQLLDSPHALLEHWVTSGLADDEIGPLHYDDADKEGCVTCELHNLPLFICLKRKEMTNKMWDQLEKKNKQTLQTHKNNLPIAAHSCLLDHCYYDHPSWAWCPAGCRAGNHFQPEWQSSWRSLPEPGSYLWKHTHRPLIFKSGARSEK